MSKLVISASQLNTFADCRRKWWFEKVGRLPEVPKGYLVFGNVLHACLERWCSADASGRVPACADPVWLSGPLVGQRVGEPVEVFPAGWETVEEKGVRSSVTPNEAGLIRRLVAQAIERGVVTRGDGSVLEREIWIPVIDGVELTGYIDRFVPDSSLPAIHDHKSFSESGARFRKQPDRASPNYLGSDDQLLTYAAATSILDGWSGDVAVRHNQFPKFEDTRGVTTVEAVVTAEEWSARWEAIQASAADMVRTREIKRWEDVPGPYGSDVCSKYGGCAFKRICGKMQTPDGYRDTVERLQTEAAERPNVELASRKETKRNVTPTPAGTDPFARAALARAKTAATRPAEAVKPAPKPPQEGINGGVAVAPPPASPFVGAPWANGTCSACKGTGFNAKGRPCQVCNALARRSKLPTSDAYDIVGDAQSGFVAKVKADKAAEVAALGAPAEWSSKQLKEQPAPQPAPAIVQQPTAVIAADAARVAMPTVPAPPSAAEHTPAPSKDAKPAESKGGRKPIGVTLLIGAVQIKGPERPFVTIQELLQKLGAEMAKDMGASSYWELDPWKRRDRLRQASEKIAADLGRTVVLVPSVGDPDTQSLVSALIPHADTIVEGLR